MSGHRPSSTRSVKGWWNSKLSLGPHDVHLWRARVQDMAQSVAEFSATLSPDEHQRASSFRRAHDREAFVLRRAILRAILSQYLPLGPAEIRFRYGGFGKPYLEPGSHRPELRFNLTHSRGLMLCAVSLGRALGVDVYANRRGNRRADRVRDLAGPPRLERDAGCADERERVVRPVGDAAERGAESVDGARRRNRRLERAGPVDVEDRHAHDAGNGDGNGFVRESRGE